MGKYHIDARGYLLLIAIGEVRRGLSHKDVSRRDHLFFIISAANLLTQPATANNEAVLLPFRASSPTVTSDDDSLGGSSAEALVEQPARFSSTAAAEAGPLVPWETLLGGDMFFKTSSIGRWELLA